MERHGEEPPQRPAAADGAPLGAVAFAEPQPSDDPPPAPEAPQNDNRVAVVDGGEIARQHAAIDQREQRKARMKYLDKEIQSLAKERRAVHEKAAQEAMRDAELARMGQQIFGSSPEYRQEQYKQESDRLMGMIRTLRAELDQLRKQEREIAR
jgi:hypothetical protein